MLSKGDTKSALDRLQPITGTEQKRSADTRFLGFSGVYIKIAFFDRFADI